MGTLFIVGSGCSRGTLGGNADCPPVAQDFVKELEARARWMSDYPELSKVIAHLRRTHDNVGLEELWTCIDLHTKFPEVFPISWKPRGVITELKSALVRMYGRHCDQLSERIPPSDTCTIVAEVANKIQAGDTLVSFNYDTLIERVVKNIGSVPMRHGMHLEPGTIRFAKPHGSTSWSIQDLGYSVTNGAPIVDSLGHEEVENGVDPLLLGAVPLKSELIFEVQEYYRSRRVFEVVREHWRTVAKAVATATRIVVLGYSFPKEDIYGRFFFHEGNSMRNDELSLSIDAFSLSDEIVTTVKKLFPMASSICFKGPVTAASLKWVAI
jgi:hypothetical protein